MRSAARIYRFVPLVCLLGLLGGLLVAPAGAASRKPDPGHSLTDDQGRSLVLHGLNTSSSAKDAGDAMPWTKQSDVAAETRTMGSNAVRLLIFWARVEPKPGHFDEHYLDAVARRIAWYHKRGVHVILDMHQDLWGPSISGGGNDGAPKWATHTDGLPVKRQDEWALTYLQPGEMRAFDHFWGNTGKHPELRSEFVTMWRHVAKRFANVPGVLGYDLFNEPWGGSAPSPIFERHRLGPLYQRTIDSIRAVDKKRWLLLEPQAFGVNQGTPSALPAMHDPRRGEQRLAYAPHLYPALLDAGQSYTGATKAITKGELSVWKHVNKRTARRLAMPLVLGEFGLDATKPGALNYVRDVQRLTKDLDAGWLYWSNDKGSWGPYDSNGGWAPLAGTLAQPYPRAIAGEPAGWNYDKGKHALRLTYTDRRSAHGPSEFFLPPREYPKAPKVSCSDTCRSHFDPRRHTLEVSVPKDGGKHTIRVGR